MVTAAPVLFPSTLNCTLVVFAETLVVTVTVPAMLAPEAGEVIEIVGGIGLFTGTETAALVVLFPALSVAWAVRPCVPFDTPVVFQDVVQGAARTGEPKLLPSTRNCTEVRVRPVLSRGIGRNAWLRCPKTTGAGTRSGDERWLAGAGCRRRVRRSSRCSLATPPKRPSDTYLMK